MPSDSLSDFMANLDANGVTPPGGFPGFMGSTDSTDMNDPADFMREMMEGLGRIPGTPIDFDSSEYLNKTPSERAAEAFEAYGDDTGDYLGSAAMDRTWTKRANLATSMGRKTEFMRAEKATWQKTIDKQKAKIRSMYPHEAEDLDKGMGRSTAWVGTPSCEESIEIDRDHCWHCNISRQDADSLKQCGGCRQARYCTAYCQKAAWKEHKATCKSSAQGRQGESGTYLE